MSRGRPDLPPQDSGQNRGFGQHQQGFGPHQYEAGARRIEQGISMGMGAHALHQELQMIREAAMQNGKFNLAQYRADVRAIDAQLHKDGYLPKLHIDVDGQGKDIVRRGGGDAHGDAHSDDSSDSGRHSGRRRHGGKRHGGGGRRRGGHGGGHRRGGHHRRGGAERSPSASEDPNQEGGPEQIASGDTIQDSEMRPDGGMNRQNAGNVFDRNNFRPDQRFDRGDNMRGPGDRQYGSSERGLDRSTATPSKNGFGEALLNKLGLPVSERNMHFLDRWQKAEGGSPDNPFNTSQNAPGARRFNSHGVKRYPDMETGVEATAKTLRNGRYNGILAGLQQENPQMAAAHLKRSAWGTKHIYV